MSDENVATPASAIEAATVPQAAELIVTDAKQNAALDAMFKGISAFTEWVGLGLDIEMWIRKLAAFEERRAQSSKESIAQAVEVALRAAAIDTGAIEGLYSLPANFTITVATRAPGWDAMVDSMGDTFKALFQSQVRAYDLAMQLSRSPVGITEAWVRDLHKELCSTQRTYRVITDLGPQDHELPVGEYKHHPNHVRLPDGNFHAYASVDATRHEMPKLIEQLRSKEFLTAAPPLQAAYSHFALVAIHPFADGNGRVARALASTYLCRAAGVPLVVFDDQKDAYYSVLRAGDHGAFAPFADFILLRSVDSLDFVSNRLGASPQQQAERVSSILRGKGLLAPGEIDLLAGAFYTLVSEEITKQVGGVKLPTGVYLQGGSEQFGQPEAASDAYRRPASTGRPNLRTLTLWTQSPQVNLNVNLGVMSAKDSSARHVCALRNEATGEMLEVRLDELYPKVSASLRLRLSSWIERTLAELLSDFATHLEGDAPRT